MENEIIISKFMEVYMKKLTIIVTCLFGFLYILVSAVAQEEQKPEFIGTKKCKICQGTAR